MNRVSSEISRLSQNRDNSQALKGITSSTMPFIIICSKNELRGKDFPASNCRIILLLKPEAFPEWYSRSEKNYVFAFALGIMLPFGFLVL
jgi:hypothetical protein